MPDTDPLALPPVPPVESSEILRRVITDPNGNVIYLGGTEERATTMPDGGVSHTRTEIRASTIDNHVIDYERGDTAHHCPRCNVGPLSRHAMTTCQACQRYVCLACVQQTTAGILCNPCAKTFRRQALLRFLLDIF